MINNYLEFHRCVEEVEKWYVHHYHLSLAVMHFCLIDCLDASYCFLPFFFGGGALMPPAPRLCQRGLGWLSASPSKNLPEVLLMARIATGDLGGGGEPHQSSFMYWQHNGPFQIADEEWVRGGGTHVWRAQSKSQCAACTLCCMYALVSAWWYFIARSVKGDAMDRMTGLLICIISCWH